MKSASQNGSVVLPPVRGPFATGAYEADTIRGGGGGGQPGVGARTGCQPVRWTAISSRGQEFAALPGDHAPVECRGPATPGRFSRERSPGHEVGHGSL